MVTDPFREKKALNASFYEFHGLSHSHFTVRVLIILIIEYMTLFTVLLLFMLVWLMIYRFIAVNKEISLQF